MKGLDLNLLVALEALLQEKHVTRAGQKVGLSQPAMSGQLARLRQFFGDDLLITDGRRTRLTPRGEELLVSVKEILEAAERLVTPQVFDPKTSDRHFKIACADDTMILLLPSVLDRLAKVAPLMSVQVVDMGHNAWQMLAAGELDLWVLPRELLGPRPRTVKQLFQDRWMCAVWKGNRLVGDHLDLKTYCALPHVAFGVAPDLPTVEVKHMRRLGIQRHVEVTVPSFTALPFLVRGSRRVALIQERLGRMFEEQADIKLVPPPFELPDVRIVMQWDPRHNGNPAHVLLRNLFVESSIV